MANLIPQAIPGGITASIQNNWDALKDDFDAVAYLPFGDEYWDAMNQIMNAIGNREIAKQNIVKWFERTRQEVPFTVDNGPVSISSGQYTVDIPASEVDATTGYSWPIKHEIWRHAPSGTLFQIVSKPDANTLVLRPLDSTFTANLADGDKFFYVGVSVPENSDNQDSKYVFDTLYSAKVQTFRHDNISSSQALYNQLWYTQLENGTQLPYSNSNDVIYLQREHQVAIVNTFLAGKSDNNLSSTTSFQTTDGLIPTIFSRGQTQDSGGDIDELDFYALEAKLTGQDGSIKNYMVWTTGSTSAQIEQNMQAYNANVNIQLNKIQMEKTFWGEGQYADLMRTTYSFNNLVFNNKNFGLVRMGIFDNPQTFNVTGSSWADYAVVIPLTSQGVDDGLGNMGKYVRLAHKPGAFMAMWETGAKAASNKTSVYQLQLHIASEIGFKFVNANKYGIFYQA